MQLSDFTLILPQHPVPSGFISIAKPFMRFPSKTCHERKLFTAVRCSEQHIIIKITFSARVFKI